MGEAIGRGHLRGNGKRGRREVEGVKFWLNRRLEGSIKVDKNELEKLVQ